ncbi:MAG: ETC complex I subunit [Ahrensia sp.]
MRARIYSPAKTAMQSGKSKTGHWVLEFDQAEAKRVEPLMGYTSSSNMMSQVKLRFNSKEEAVAYAQKNGIAARVDEPKIARRRKASYSENFAFSRRIPWTH